jgi:hypothetical protein
MVNSLLDNKNSSMTSLTRDILIKTIVAEEMKMCDSSDYREQLQKTYHKWEHESSNVLCQKFNQIEKSNITVDILKP